MVASDPSKFSSVVESEREPLTSLSSKDLVFIHLELHFQLCIPCHVFLPCSPCLLTPWDRQALLPHVSINMMFSLTLSKVIEPANCGLKPRTKIKVSSFVVGFFFSILWQWQKPDCRIDDILFSTEKIYILHTYLYKNSHGSGTARYKTYMHHPKLSRSRTSS